MIEKSRLAGMLWLIAAVLAIAITVLYRIEIVQWVVTIAAGVAAVIIGVLLLRRPGAPVFIWSNVAGVAWLVIYAALIIQQRAELAAWVTDVFLGALGVAAAAFAYRASALL